MEVKQAIIEESEWREKVSLHCRLSADSSYITHQTLLYQEFNSFLWLQHVLQIIISQFSEAQQQTKELCIWTQKSQ